MSDLISRQAAIDTIMGQPPEPHYPSWYAAQIEKLPAVQPDHTADIGKKVEGDCISRQAAIDAVADLYWMDERLLNFKKEIDATFDKIKALPSAQPEIKPIEYLDCANAMLRMWMDNVVTDGEYNRIMDKLNAHYRKENSMTPMLKHRGL